MAHTVHGFRAIRPAPRFLLSCLSALLIAAAGRAQLPTTRVAATTLRMPSEGTTLTYTYKTTAAFGGIFFEQPVQVVFPPNDSQRAFVVERPGRVSVVRYTANPTRDVFLDLTGRTKTANGGLLSLAFHPQFSQNGFFYVWYSTYVGSQRANRLARFRVSSTNPAVADPTPEAPLITQLTGLGGRVGGMILFGPDGYLYLSVGNGDQNLPEINAAHQRIDRGLFGSLLRSTWIKNPAACRPTLTPPSTREPTRFHPTIRSSARPPSTAKTSSPPLWPRPRCSSESSKTVPGLEFASC